MNQTNRRNLILDAMADPNGKFFVEIDATRGVYRFNGSEIEEVWYDETETAILPFTETCGNGTTCSSAARSWRDCGPRLASTTSVRYWVRVTSPSIGDSEAAAIPTSTRDAVRTASATSATSADFDCITQ